MKKKLDILNSRELWLSPHNLIKIQPPTSSLEDRGNNILHFNTKDRQYRNNPSAKKFVEEVLIPQNAIECFSDSEAILYAVKKAKELNPDPNGIYLEFGFCTGRSLNFIAALAYAEMIYGFDSGEGLPSFWRPGFDTGTFAYNDINKIPFCPLDNTHLILGKIEETLPIFIEEYLSKYNRHVSFIHIDTDIYSTASEIYRHLGNYIKPEKTILLLDEGYNYWETEDMYVDEGWKSHEYKATNEFAVENDYQIQYLCYNSTHQQLVLQFKHLFS